MLSNDIALVARQLAKAHEHNTLSPDVVSNLVAQLHECATRARALERLVVPFEGRAEAAGEQIVSLADARKARPPATVPATKPEGGQP